MIKTSNKKFQDEDINSKLQSAQVIDKLAKFEKK